MTSGRISEEDLHALVDDRLPAERRAELEQVVAADPELARRTAAYRRHRDALRAQLLRPEDPVPPRLRIAALVAARRQRRARALGFAAAACLCIVVGAGIGYVASRGLTEPPGAGGEAWTALAEDAVAAHRVFAVEIAHPVEVDASRKDHLARWISNRLKHDIALPDLSPLGYRLMGGRVLPAPGSIAAQLMYEDASGGRISVYIRPGRSEPTAFRYLAEDAVASVYWADDDCGYVVAGALDRQRLAALADAAFRGLEDAPGPPGGRG